MTHTVKFTVRTECVPSAITAFNMVVTDKVADAVLESFSEASVAATTAGITFTAGPVGGLPTIVVDESVIAQDVRVTFVDFTTACGTTEVDEFADVAVAVAAGAALTQNTMGCAAVGGAIRDMCSQNYAFDKVNSVWTWISSDGKIGTLGPNSAPSGLGVNDDGAFEPNGAIAPDTNLLRGRNVDNFPVAQLMPNAAFYLPDVTFKHVRHSVGVSSTHRLLALSDDGRLFAWGGAFLASNPSDLNFQRRNAEHSWLGQGAGDTTVQDFRKSTDPLEIFAPNGAPWEYFFTNNLADTIWAVAGGQWYSWGHTARDGLNGLAHDDGARVVRASAEILPAGSRFYPTPTPCSWPIMPDPSVGWGPQTFRASTNSLELSFIDATGAIVGYGGFNDRPMQRWGQPTTGAQLNGAKITTSTGAKIIAYEHLWIGQADFTLMLADDGEMYFLGGGTQSPSGGAPLQGASGPVNRVANPVPREAGVPSGVKFVRFASCANSAVMVGDDGNLYAMQATNPIKAVDWVPETMQGDALDVWSHDDATGQVYTWTTSTGKTYTARFNILGEAMITHTQAMKSFSSIQTTFYGVLTPELNAVLEASC